MNLTPHHEDVEFTKGDDIVFNFSVDSCANVAGVIVETPIDISGWTVTCTAEKVDGVAIDNITVTTVDDYTRKIKVPKTETDEDDRNYAVYRIVCVNDAGDRRTYIKGNFKQVD